jgi:hypothetical protein
LLTNFTTDQYRRKCLQLGGRFTSSTNPASSKKSTAVHRDLPGGEATPEADAAQTNDDAAIESTRFPPAPKDPGHRNG